MLKKLQASILFYDIRNFTPTLKKFEKNQNDGFINYIEKIMIHANKLLSIITTSNNYHLLFNGDGFFIVFKGNENEKFAYLFSLIFFHKANIIESDFNKKYNENISYGMGVDSGIISEVHVENMINYLGSPINRAARIESKTKDIARSKVIFGEDIVDILCIQLLNYDYKAQREYAIKLKDSDEVDIAINKMHKKNQELLLGYLFTHNLKGVDKPVGLCRLSQSLVQMDNPRFHKILELILDNNQIKAIENYLK
jgi:class 3 adenylate cyclase